VTVGPIPETEITAYLDSGQWRGKAGAYNLAERLQAGWPISVEGDPGTVMGLPMVRLAERLRAIAAAR
jgi:septum formation protein